MVSGNAVRLNNSTSQMIAIRLGVFQIWMMPSRRSVQADTRPVTVAVTGSVAFLECAESVCEVRNALTA